jgi:hypothetical protein
LLGLHNPTMSRIISSISSETTTTLENGPSREEIPSLAQILMSIDVSNVRTDAGRHELRNTIQALVSRAEIDAVDTSDYLKLAILIGFKRRNHDKSQAPGVGAGERDCLRIILHEIYSLQNDIVKRVLPLVPTYGSWRDLQVLAEMAFPVEGTVGGLSEDISQIFASQLQRDNTLITSSAKDCPSNACKYAPHEFRHNGSRKNRKAEKKSQGRKIQSRLGDAIATILFPSSTTHVRPQYRKLLSSLNSRLTKNGFLVEPLMCRNEKSKIQFNRAPKGSLDKYRKAIMKDPVASQKWKFAMGKSDAAVPDINDVSDLTKQILDNEDPNFIAMIVGKCVSKLRATRSELFTKASKILTKLISSQEAGDESTREVTQELQIGSGVTIYPVVDSNEASSAKIISLLLCAYIVARAQKLSHFIYDGTLVNLYDDIANSDETQGSPDGAPPSAPPSERQEEIDKATNFILRVVQISQSLSPLRNRGDIQRISENVSTLLDSVPFDLNASNSTRHIDCLFLTLSSLQEVQGEMEQYSTMLNNLQHRPMTETTLRTLCIHRLIHTYDADGTVPLVMRSTRPITDRSTVSLDLLLVMDLTGSMGAWMDQAKQHLTGIVNSLKEDTGIGEIRVGFVGYRDFGDEGRTVEHPFVPIARSEQVLTVIRAQQPSGGGDLPEDVLSAFTLARTNFSWNSDLRLMLFVADAPAHGYCAPSQDYHRSGRCPDQAHPHLDLKETTIALADQCQVDLLFCKLGPATQEMEELFQEIYGSGGFGILPITSGTDSFRAAILATISSSILKVLAPENIDGLQTFAGATASSLFGTVNSSLRESLASIAKTFHDDMEVVNDIVGEDGIDLGITGGEDDEEAEDDDENETGDDGETKIEVAKGEGEKTVEAPVKRTNPVTTSARTDYERIMSELNLEELVPVRLALGMPVDISLLDKSAEILFNAGVTVQDLHDQGYPEGIIEALTNSGLKKLGTI